MYTTPHISNSKCSWTSLSNLTNILFCHSYSAFWEVKYKDKIEAYFFILCSSFYPRDKYYYFEVGMHPYHSFFNFTIHTYIHIYIWLYFGGSKITADGDCSHEIKRCLFLGKKVMTNLDGILKSRDITLPTKVHLVKAMVFSEVMYGCESWTVKKAEHWRIDAF